jgi:hypothetical protein
MHENNTNDINVVDEEETTSEEEMSVMDRANLAAERLLKKYETQDWFKGVKVRKNNNQDPYLEVIASGNVVIFSTFDGFSVIRVGI